MRMSLAPYVSAAALVLCSLLVLNWVHSYDRCEYSNRYDGGVITVVGSNKGTLYFVQMDAGAFPNREWKHNCSKVNDRQAIEYQFEWNLQKRKLVVPYRLVVPVFALIGVAPWIRSKRSLIDAALIALPHVAGIIARLH